MPTNTFSSARTQSAEHHWYNRLPSRPIRRRRYGSSVFNNVWNAFSNFGNAAQGNSGGLLATMRTQAYNLAQIIDGAALPADQKPFLQQLAAETKQALDSLNPALMSQQVTRASSHSPSARCAVSERSMRRLASEESAISSNAKAALGCMAYLQDDQLFPGCLATYQYVAERLVQIYRLMDGDYSPADVEAVRQQGQQELAPQQAAPMVGNADGTTTAYTPSPGSTALYMPQTQSVAQPQTFAPVARPTASGTGQAPVPSPVAGLEAKSPSWNGTPNTTADGQETVGSRQDWFSLYGTTVERFAARCTNWMRQNGQGQAALVAHLQASGVPGNVIGQVLPYV